MGKGDKWRKGLNFKKYQDAPYWKKLKDISKKDKIQK